MPVGGLVPKVAQAQTAGRGQEMRQDKTDGKKQEGGDAEGKVGHHIRGVRFISDFNVGGPNKEFEVVHLSLKGVRIAPRHAASHSLAV